MGMIKDGKKLMNQLKDIDLSQLGELDLDEIIEGLEQVQKDIANIYHITSAINQQYKCIHYDLQAIKSKLGVKDAETEVSR